jgi:DNA-binding MarR family transcriptional regulator
MTPDAPSLIAVARSIARAEAWARRRLARLLLITEMQARAVLWLGADRSVTLEALAAELDLSEGGAIAFVQRLESEGLICRVPDPERPRSGRLRLAPGAALERRIALEPLPGRLAVIARGLRPAERQVVARYLDELAGAVR